MRRRSLLAGLAATSAGSGIALAARDGGVRRDAAGLPAAAFSTMAAAIGAMQRRSARDPDDPAGWTVHAAGHAAVCGAGGAPDALRVHGTWWFLPWHRAFLLVTEWKLRAVSGDPSLCLPYWDWISHPRVPAAFAEPGSPLAAARRFTASRDLRPSEVGCAGPGTPYPALHAAAFTATSRAGISLSFGGAPDGHPEGWRGRSRLEGVPHAAVHNFVGGEAGDGRLGDMARLSSAALDPVFLAHHANLDRLWEAWRAHPGHRATEPRDPAFLDKRFQFSWVDGTSLVLRVGDLLDTAAMGYRYDRLNSRRDGPPLSSPSLEMPLATASLHVPAMGPEQRTDLVLRTRLASPRPINAEVLLGGTVVGAVSISNSATPPAFPDTNWRFDVTAVLARLGPGPVPAAIVPLPLSPAGLGPHAWSAEMSLEPALA